MEPTSNQVSPGSVDNGLDPRSVRNLRRLWKPHKEHLSISVPNHPTVVRIHRALSWIERVEAIDSDSDDDFALIGQWVAFNALYGRWDTLNRQPYAERESWQQFMERILALDLESRLVDVLQEQKPLVMSILENEYLSRYFWQEPTIQRAGKSKKSMYDARTWYLEGRWVMVLDRMLERIYLLRCQLMHGAATHGGKLNRGPLRSCVTMLSHLMPAMLLVMISRGAEEDWGEMCYPPLYNSSQAPDH